MMAFEFVNVTAAKLVDVNPRSVKHGKTVLLPAVDIQLSAEVPNHVLAMFHPELKDLLYAGSGQGQLPGVDGVSDATELRFPEWLGPHEWKAESEGYTLAADYGIDDTLHIRFTDCKLHKRTFLPKRGGTCTVTFTLTCSVGLEAEPLGHFAMHIGHQVHIRLTKQVVETA
jgi:hypothetical protein